jgi:hypothetical protein
MSIAQIRDEGELRRLRRRAAALRRTLAIIRPKVIGDRWQRVTFIPGSPWTPSNERANERSEIQWSSFE